MTVVILKTGTTFDSLARREGDFEDWTRAPLGVPEGHVRVVDARTESPLPAPPIGSAVVVTGSPEMVTDEPPWMLAAAAWIKELVSRRVPVLGICYGHQLLAHALGGTVGELPAGREIGTVSVTALGAASRDPLFEALPGEFPAHTSHRESVLRLPPGAERLARSEREPNQAFRVGRRAWGVQFHPEFSELVMRSYIEWHRERLSNEGMDPESILAAVRPSPAGLLLKRFAALAGSRREARERE